MIVKPAGKPQLTDAQFEALTHVAARGSETARRFIDTRTVMTLVALAKRQIVTLTWGPVDGRPRGIQSATLTNKGTNALATDTALRAAIAEYNAHMEMALAAFAPAPVVAEPDPVAVEAAPVLVDADDAPYLAIETGEPGEPAIVIASRSMLADLTPLTETVYAGDGRYVPIPF